MLEVCQECPMRDEYSLPTVGMPDFSPGKACFVLRFRTCRREIQEDGRHIRDECRKKCKKILVIIDSEMRGNTNTNPGGVGITYKM